MKVVLLLTQARGGPADVTTGVATELAGRIGGPEITVLGPESLLDCGLPSSLLRPVHVRSKLDGSGVHEVSKLLGELTPDVVHAQDHRAGLVCSLVAGQCPTVLTFHGVPDSAAGRWVDSGPFHGRRAGMSGRSRLLAGALVARRMRCTVAPSRAMAEFLRRELRIPPSQIRVLHNGAAIPSLDRTINKVRTFATMGSFAPCKAAPLLVSVFTAMAADRGDLRLVMMGDGAERRSCEEIVRQARGLSRVEFTGYLTDVKAKLAQADAFVLPSLNENMPLALLQAMAHGLPCVASDVGGIKEVLADDCGLLVKPGDGTALRAAMERLIDEPALASRLGRAARRRVVERFSLARCADDHFQLWSDLHRGAQR